MLPVGPARGDQVLALADICRSHSRSHTALGDQQILPSAADCMGERNAYTEDDYLEFKCML